VTSIAVYAMGGGLGHLTRVRAALHTLGREDEEVSVLAESPFAADDRLTEGWTVVTPPAEVHLESGGADHDALVTWLRTALDAIAPDELWLDAFPAGLFGEVDRGMLPAGVRTMHLARLLHWERYAAAMPTAPVHFDQTYLVEDVQPEHRRSLEALSTSIESLTLIDPPATMDLLAAAAMEALRPPRWLVAHAGSRDEVVELLGYAQDLASAEGITPSLAVASPHTVVGVTNIDALPVWPLFSLADRVITGAGFNTMRQAAALELGDRHRFLPLPRRYDDQFERAKRARRT
jgi:hypothetical protein